MRQQQRQWQDAHGDDGRAGEAWDANSLTPETQLTREPTVQLSPAPPLPDENRLFEFQPLPQTNPGIKLSDLPPLETATASDDDQPAMQFAPLPQIERIETRDLPPIKGIETHALPEFPVEPRGIEAAPGESRPAMQFAPLPQIERIETRDLPPIKGVETHVLPDFPVAPALDQIPAQTAEPVGEDEQLEIRPLLPQEEIKFKDSPLPDLGQKNKAELPVMAEFDFVKRLPKRDLLSSPAARRLNAPSPATSNYLAEDVGLQLVTAQLEISGLKLAGPGDSDMILGIPDDTGSASAALTASETPAAVVAKLPEALWEKQKKAKKKAKEKAKKKVVAAPKKGSSPKSASSKKNAKDDYALAAQPKLGAHYIEDKPQTDHHAHLIEPLVGDFSPDATSPQLPYEPRSQVNVYQGKTLNANQRPLVELGRPWYQLGQLSPGSSVLGFHNNVTPQFLVFGDHRTGYASNRQNGNSTSQIATQLNLDFDLKLTGTERFHAFVQPLSSNGRNTRRLLDDDEFEFEGSANPLFGYFDGDLGALVGGAINKTLPFDLPFTAGIIPLVFQNGVWLEDAILGVAATIPARNNARFNISNMDLTFFAGYDKIDSPAFEAANRNAAGDQYGVGFRYQLPLSNSVIFRTDGMYGFLVDDEDISLASDWKCARSFKGSRLGDLLES